jgi:hypothetical protein
MNFQGGPGIIPDPETEQVGGNWYGSGTLVTIIPRSLKPSFRDPGTETGKLETEQ